MIKGKFGMDLSKLMEIRKLKPLKEFPISTEELCNRYERLFTGAVSDVLREWTLIDQALPNILPVKLDMKVAGIVFTIKGSKNVMFEEGVMEHRAEILEHIHKNSVVVLDTSNDNEASQWGGVVTRAAIKKGCKGAVVDGGIRDTHEILAQNFPVFSRYRTPNAMYGRFRYTHYQVLIKIGNVLIKPGDVVFGDIDGVLVIPREVAYDVLLRSEEILEIEGSITKWVDEDTNPTEVVKRGGYF
jgi:4-hydroxy-4-methyl-2-oxoglutarate aldolase